MSVTTFFPAHVSANAAPTVSDAGVTDSFPNGMTFAVSASSDSPINELKIRYKVLPDGTSAIASPKFQPVTVPVQVIRNPGDFASPARGMCATSASSP